MNQVKDSSWVPSCVCLKSRLSAVNRQSGAHWEFIGKPPVKRTVTISLVSAHCTDTPHSLFLSCGHTAERQVGVVLFSDLLVARYAGGCFGMFNELCDCSSTCALACLLTPLTCTSFPPVTEQRQREASTENISLKVTS